MHVRWVEFTSRRGERQAGVLPCNSPVHKYQMLRPVHKSAWVNRPQKLLDNEQFGNNPLGLKPDREVGYHPGLKACLGFELPTAWIPTRRSHGNICLGIFPSGQSSSESGFFSIRAAVSAGQHVRTRWPHSRSEFPHLNPRCCTATRQHQNNCWTRARTCALPRRS